MNKCLRIVFTCIIVCSLCTKVRSQEVDRYAIITLYDGASFRPGNLRNVTELSLEWLNINGNRERDQGISATFEIIGGSSYSAGLKYFRTPLNGFSILYLAIQPNFYYASGATGLNLRPEAGLLYDLIWQHVFGLRFKFSYGYDIPLSNPEMFVNNRNIIAFEVGLTYNKKHKIIY